MLPRRALSRVLGNRAFHAGRTAPSSEASYPFAKTATTKEVDATPPQSLLRGKGLIEHVRNELVPPQKREWLKTLFSSRHRQRLLPGSIISVGQTHSPTNFAGVLIAMRRKGACSSLTVRNVVQRIGVEVQVFLGSPHWKSIKILQRADGKAGRKSRRAKLYYLRDAPEKMTAISSSFGK